MKLIISSLILLVAFSMNAGAQIEGLDNYMTRKAQRREQPRMRQQINILIIENTTKDSLFFEIQQFQGGLNRSIDQMQPYMGYFDNLKRRIRPNRTEEYQFVCEGYNLVIYKYDAAGQKVIVKQLASRVRHGRQVVRI